MSSPDTAADPAIFDAEFLARLRVLFVRLRRRRNFQRRGAQEAPAAGHSREFKDHRQYGHGDDIRTIDWRLYGRLDRLFVRVFEEVQEFHVYILLDRSRSLAQPHPGKRVAALRLAAALAYLGLSHQHRVSLFGFDQTLNRELPPLKGPGHIHAVIHQLLAGAHTGTGDPQVALAGFKPSGGRRGLVFVISDLLGGDPGRSSDLVRRMAGWPSEVHVLHLLDPTEERPQERGELRLVDVEGGGERRVWMTADALDRYATAFAAWRSGIARECLGHSIGYQHWNTAKTFESQFVTLLERGCGMGG